MTRRQHKLESTGDISLDAREAQGDRGYLWQSCLTQDPLTMHTCILPLPLLDQLCR
jgi:hypothetical protein